MRMAGWQSTVQIAKTEEYKNDMNKYYRIWMQFDRQAFWPPCAARLVNVNWLLDLSPKKKSFQSVPFLQEWDWDLRRPQKKKCWKDLNNFWMVFPNPTLDSTLCHILCYVSMQLNMIMLNRHASESLQSKVGQGTMLFLIFINNTPDVIPTRYLCK